MTVFIWTCIVLITLSMVLVSYRLVKGPNPGDRVIALDTIGVLLICVIGLFSIIIETSYFLEIILLLAYIIFIGISFYALQGLRIEQLFKKGRTFQIQLFYVLISIVIGSSVAVLFRCHSAE